MSSAAIEKDRGAFEARAEELLQHCNKSFAQASLPLANALVDGIRGDFF
jgi:hypothetical protein